MSRRGARSIEPLQSGSSFFRPDLNVYLFQHVVQGLAELNQRYEHLRSQGPGRGDVPVVTGFTKPSTSDQPGVIPPDFLWVNKANVLKALLHKAVMMLQIIGDFQATGPCPCRSIKVFALKEVLLKARDTIVEMTRSMCPDHVAYTGLTRTRNFTQDALIILERSMDTSKDALGAVVRIATLPFTTYWSCRKDLSPQQATVKEVNRVLDHFMTPGLLQCSCYKQFNCLLVRALVDLARKVLVSTIYLSLIPLMSYRRYPALKTGYVRRDIKGLAGRAKYMCTSLHVAVILENRMLIEQALKCGVNVNKQDSLGSTALHLATLLGCNNLVYRLINAHADPNIPDLEGNTPVHVATLTWNMLALRSMSVKSMNPTLLNKAGYSPLQLALCSGDSDVIKLLVQTPKKNPNTQKPPVPPQSPSSPGGAIF